MQPVRKIASNLLWTPQGVVRNPLITLDEAGNICAVEFCADPDRQSVTEFYAGLLVPGFPADYRTAFETLLARSETPLSELLPPLTGGHDGILVVLSGLDYTTLRLTSRSCIQKL